MAVARVYVCTEAFVGQLSEEERLWVAQNHEKVVSLFTTMVKRAAMKRLEFIEPHSFPWVQRFVVEEKFRESEIVDGIRIVCVGKNFKTFLLKKIEESVPSLAVGEQRLLVNCTDAEIVGKLGGEERAEIHIAHLWESLKIADRTKWLLCYVRDADGILWRISGYWRGGGLDIEATPLNLEVQHPADRYDIRLFTP